MKWKIHPRIHGQQFENILSFHANHQGIYIEKMPLGLKRYGKKMYQIRTNFDFMFIHNGQVVFIDAKSHENDRFNYSLITPHQASALARLEENGCVAGYICWHRNSNIVSFYHGSKLIKVRPGESITPLDGVYLGTFEDIALGTLFV